MLKISKKYSKINYLQAQSLNTIKLKFCLANKIYALFKHTELICWSHFGINSQFLR